MAAAWGAPRPFLGKPNAAHAGGVSPLKVQHGARAVGLGSAWPTSSCCFKKRDDAKFSL